MGKSKDNVHFGGFGCSELEETRYEDPVIMIVKVTVDGAGREETPYFAGQCMGGHRVKIKR